MDPSRGTISVVIPTLNAGERLAQTFAALIPATVEGLIKEVIISDGGSEDETLAMAAAAGARIVSGEKGRGGQLARGAEVARAPWLLFLHADTRLDASWAEEARGFLADEEKAGVFTLEFDSARWQAGLVARGAMVRTHLFRAPYGDQGLLISRKLYDDLGGYSAVPLFEDVEIIDRLLRKKGRKALHVFQSRATTSPERYERQGYAARVFRNLACLTMYRAGVSPEKIVDFYNGKR